MSCLSPPAASRSWRAVRLVILGAVLQGCASRTIPLVNVTDQGRQWVWPYFLDGQPTVLAFWSTNEMECLRNVPALQGLDARGGSVQLVTVVTGRDRLEISRWIREKKIRYPVLLDLDERLALHLGVDQVPSFLFFGPDGKELDRRSDIRLVRKWFDEDGRLLRGREAIAPASSREASYE